MLMIQLRQANIEDLEHINRVIESAIQTWNLPARVKRLSLASYFYNVSDLMHQTLLIALIDQCVVGVAAWEEVNLRDIPELGNAILLHGIYVDPAYQKRGVGTKLFEYVYQVTCEQKVTGLVVKAQPDAVAFFLAMGMKQLAIQDENRDYPYRFWKACEK